MKIGSGQWLSVRKSQKRQMMTRRRKRAAWGYVFKFLGHTATVQLLCVGCGEASVGNKVFEINIFLLYMVWDCF